MKSRWILASVLICASVAFGQGGEKKAPTRKPVTPSLKIINDSLLVDGYFYAVKGSVYNPSDRGVKNVVIRYYIWKKYMGDAAPTVSPYDGTKLPISWKQTGGLVAATIKYLPPKQTVDFIAKGEDAHVMTKESQLVPEPINAEITAEWD